MHRRSIAKTFIIVLTVLLFAVAVFIVLHFKQRSLDSGTSGTDSAGAQGMDPSEESYSTVKVNGKTYKYRSNLRTVLFMGIDKSGDLTQQDYTGYGGQADSIILFIIDPDTKEIKMFSVSRDTMMDIKVYDTDGNYLTTINAQLALQYAYGDGMKRSSQLVKEDVSGLLFDIPIASYVTFDVGGVGPLTSAIGGVNVTVPEDDTWIDPSLTEGSSVNLSGSLAEAFVRQRNKEVLDGNNNRMQRQLVFMKALFAKIKASGDFSGLYNTMTTTADGKYLSDVSADDMKKFMTYTLSDTVYTSPGTVTRGDENAEFHTDFDKLYSMVLDLFYEEQ
mgnify:CR=1 FL=1